MTWFQVKFFHSIQVKIWPIVAASLPDFDLYFQVIYLNSGRIQVAFYLNMSWMWPEISGKRFPVRGQTSRQWRPFPSTRVRWCNTSQHILSNAKFGAKWKTTENQILDRSNRAISENIKQIPWSKNNMGGGYERCALREGRERIRHHETIGKDLATNGSPPTRRTA